jgi:hypothetical protein
VDIFISYKSDERSVAKQLATKLTQAGYSVWWDNALLAGDRFHREIEVALDTSLAVVVLWSRQSIQSEWVQAEAERARRAEKVIPVIIDDLLHTELPMLFHGLHVASLNGWDGSARNPGYKALLSALKTRAGQPGPTMHAKAAEAKLAKTVKESEVWAEITHPDHESIEEYRSYLTSFGPDSRFAELAKVRVARMARAPARFWSVPTAVAIVIGALIGSAAISTFLWVVLPLLTRAPSATAAPVGPVLPAVNHTDETYGFVLTFPGEFAEKGSDGLYEWNGAFLTLLSGSTHKASFRRQIETLQERALSQGGSLTYRSNDKSHFSGFTSEAQDRIFYVGALPLCAGSNYGGFRLEYAATSKSLFDPIIEKISASMHSSGWGMLCTYPRPTKGTIRAGTSGSANLRVRPASDGIALATLPDRTSVNISSFYDTWYKVIVAGGQEGYVSQQSVKVDQYVDIGFERRFIQIVSFSDVEEAKAYVNQSRRPLSVYLSITGWYAVTLAETYHKDEAAAVLATLLADAAVPRDSTDTYGNTYVRKICSRGLDQLTCV